MKMTVFPRRTKKPLNSKMWWGFNLMAMKMARILKKMQHRKWVKCLKEREGSERRDREMSSTTYFDFFFRYLEIANGAR